MSTLDALFAEINSYPLTVKAPTKIAGRKLKGKNELPLISQSVANAIATVAWSIASPRGQSNIQKTIETSVKRKFLPFVNAYSRANRKSMHHVYEWEKIGITSARLFDLKVSEDSRGRANFSMRVAYRPSKTLVPLTISQATPNEKTGAVVKRQHVFWNKAMVMEYGQTVTVRPLGDKKMAFDNPRYGEGVTGTSWTRNTDNPLVFTSRPVKIKYSSRQTYRGLENAIAVYFRSVGKQDVGRSVKEYGKKVRRGAGKSTHMITVSTPSDAYAHTVAKKIADSLVVNL